MALSQTQHNSFLGGEVSPRLWHRADMDKFGKWFAKAENVRLHTIGTMENRNGFKYASNTYNNLSGEPIKLLSFAFNNEEAYLIELSQNRFRVMQKGEYIKDSTGKPLEFVNPIEISDDQDLKYAQSADIVFIATGNQPVYELQRLKEDATSWQIIPFETDFLPMEEENTDVDKKITISAGQASENFVASFFISNYDNSKFIKDFKIKITDTEGAVYENSFNPSDNLIDSVVAMLNTSATSTFYKLTASYSDNTLYFSPNDEWTAPTYKSIEISYYTRHKSESLASLEQPTDYDISVFPEIDTTVSYLLGIKYPSTEGEGYVINTRVGIDYAISSINSLLPTGLELSKLQIDENRYKLLLKDTSTNTYPSFKMIKTYEQGNVQKVDYAGDKNIYTATANFEFFADKKVGESFVLRSLNDSEDIDLFLGTNATAITSKIIKGPGNWRFVTSGNWVGWIKLYYSDDNKKTWTLFRTLTGKNVDNPRNDNVSGEIESNDIVFFKAEYLITSYKDGNDQYKLHLYFETDSYEVNSYYKIMSIANNKEAKVICTKNDIGSRGANFKWRESSFSDKNGYPTCIGFYQNRMFLGKGYTLYGSKTNDFWDFYEPIDLSDDDPVIISLLTYKVNNLKNILTMRQFFAFTSGGEFGLSSSGALTQTDKYLLPYSYNGSNRCNPILIGNTVLFVDASERIVRMFQYAFETDTYEAQDATVLVEQFLDGKKMITTDVLKNDKECLFLLEDGTIFVFKSFPEQNIMAWYHWKHAKYRITNICVVPRGSEEDLYIACDTEKGKTIELMTKDIFSDSRRHYVFEAAATEVQTDFAANTAVIVEDGERKYEAKTDANGIVKLLKPSYSVYIGLKYIATATLLSPTIQQQDSTFTTYNKNKPFRAHFCYRDSYGFVVGVEEGEKMEVVLQPTTITMEEQDNLTTGKKSVLIPSRYDGSSRVSFIQERPYPMVIENILLEVDYGGK